MSRDEIKKGESGHWREEAVDGGMEGRVERGEERVRKRKEERKEAKAVRSERPL